MASAKHKVFSFTLPRLEALKPAAREYTVADSGQPGLTCRVLPSGEKTLQVYRRPKGSHRPARIKICEVGAQALEGKKGVRNRVRDILSDLENGINPNEQTRIKKAQEAAEVFTLKQAIDGYIETATIKPSTAEGYKSVINKHLHDWLNLPLQSITGSMVKARHKEITKTHPVAANNTMRVLRLLFKHYQEELEDETTGESPIPNSPTRKLRKKWNKETRRKTYIKPGSMVDWWTATEAITATREGTKKYQVPVYRGGDGELARDYLQFVVLTGLRRREASGLTWDRIDLKNKVFTVTNTKNEDDLELPLSDYLIEILERRQKATKGNPKPFPIDEVKKFVAWVCKKSGVSFTVHDLRRTFVTYAEALDFGAYTLKALINHRTGGDHNDVTAGYVVINTERLREPMQKITNFILKNAGVKKTEVVKLGSKQV